MTHDVVCKGGPISYTHYEGSIMHYVAVWRRILVARATQAPFPTRLCYR